MVRLILADDHKIMREGIKALLEKFTDMEIIAETENGIDTINTARELLPDVILMDISMPKMNGIEATRQILEEIPGIKIIILTMYSDRRFIAEVMSAGASGYLIKDCAFDELVNAIHVVMEGRIYISNSISGALVKEYLEKVYSKDKNPIDHLTEKEKIIMQLVAEGKNSKEIANHLELSIKTVDTHRNNLMRKLDISSVAELTKFAIKEGFVKL